MTLTDRSGEPGRPDAEARDYLSEPFWDFYVPRPYEHVLRDGHGVLQSFEDHPDDYSTDLYTELERSVLTGGRVLTVDEMKQYVRDTVRLKAFVVEGANRHQHLHKLDLWELWARLRAIFYEPLDWHRECCAGLVNEKKQPRRRPRQKAAAHVGLVFLTGRGAGGPASHARAAAPDLRARSRRGAGGTASPPPVAPCPSHGRE
jgi:hypothetical protein